MKIINIKFSVSVKNNLKLAIEALENLIPDDIETIDLNFLKPNNQTSRRQNEKRNENLKVFEFFI